MEKELAGDFEGTFPFEPRYLTAGEIRLHYVDEGPRDAPPLLFAHGNPTWSYLWRRQIAALSERGHRCVAFDHMGFGRSDKPPYLAAYSLRAHVDNALALIDALDLSDVVLVAHDWGGPIGLGALLERRERLRGLALMNTWAWELPSFLRRSCASSGLRGSARSSRSAATSSSSRSPVEWRAAISTR
jgi:cis-3-alkyl-4-acyloxetan-2-one decarboxylase